MRLCYWTRAVALLAISAALQTHFVLCAEQGGVRGGEPSSVSDVGHADADGEDAHGGNTTSKDAAHASPQQHGNITVTAQEASHASTSSSSNGEGAASAHGDAGGDHEVHVHEVYAVLFPWFVQALGVVTFFLLTRHLHALPYTAALFLLGLFMGVGASIDQSVDQLTASIRLWTGIDAEVLFTVFLPGLLFKDALEVNFHLFQASIWQLLMLAFPLVLAGTMLTACVAMFVFPYGWSFHQALTFGSILAATDPVAVAALLNEVGAPPRLKVHVSGESLLNDGSAVVFFFVFGGLFLHELGIDSLAGYSTVGDAFAIFFRMALGGTAVGIAFAAGLIFILYMLDRRMEPEETVLQVAATVTVAYLSFYTSEVVCKMSGVIAVVTCGIVTKAFGGGMISDWQVMDSFWSLLEHLLNTVIFALGGIVFGAVVTREHWTGSDWGYLILLYVFVNVIRFFLMFLVYPINSRIGIGTNWRETLFSSWGGLRGAVGITLALALDNEITKAAAEDAAEDVDNRLLATKMFGMVGGIALMTLVINGTSSGPLLARLGIADSTESRKRIVGKAHEAARRRVLDDFIHLLTDERFRYVDFAVVMHHCPLLRDLTAKELQAAVEDNRNSVHPALYKAPNLDYVLRHIKDSGGARENIMKAKMDFFTAAGAGTGLGLSTGAVEDVPITRRRSSFAIREDDEETIEASPALIRDTRLMFVELLRAAYTAQVKDGELDAREFDGFLVYSLFQGLEFMHDAASSGAPLNDWHFSHKISTGNVLNAGYRVRRCLDFCGAKHKGPIDRLQSFRSEDSLQYQKLRLDVLRALSFIDAHMEAQDRLRDEFGGSKGEEASAFLAVMTESKGEIRKAKDILRSKTKKNLNHVISHYLCTILQNKAARYVRLLLDSGVLLQREARHFLEEIDTNIREIRKCPLDKHPGSMDDAIDVGIEEPRRGRKRVKQKSIL